MSRSHSINAKGQVVIPKPLRERFGLKPGMPVSFREEKGKLVLVKGGVDPVDRVAGVWKSKGLPGGLTTDEFIEALRGR